MDCPRGDAALATYDQKDINTPWAHLAVLCNLTGTEVLQYCDRCGTSGSRQPSFDNDNPPSPPLRDFLNTRQEGTRSHTGGNRERSAYDSTGRSIPIGLP